MHGSTHAASPAARERLTLGIVGGSGLYAASDLHEVESVELDTPFGSPSAAYTVGTLSRGPLPASLGMGDLRSEDGLRVVFLPRHGVGHTLLPSEINYRANIHGFKQLGVTHLVSVSAVGSLREDIAPGDVVVPDQFLDWTKGRVSTFFGGGAVGHVSFGAPTCDRLRDHVAQAAGEQGVRVHRGGTCVVIEGPAFSTRAESELFRSFGAAIIGMTAIPEAKLAREAEIAYAMMALTTDYDCWRDGHAEVTVHDVVTVMHQNVALARRAIVRLGAALPRSTAALPPPAACKDAVLTHPSHLSETARQRLDLLIGHYLAPHPQNDRENTP